MRTWLAAAVLAAILSAAAPASADWQWTRWGMTEAEVLAASAGGVVRDEAGGPSYRLKSTGSYVAGPVTFEEVGFRFSSDGRLDRVMLRSPGGDPERIAQAIEASLGPPVSVSSTGLTRRVYRDAAKGNTVKLMIAGDAVFVEYSPLASDF